MTTMSSDKQPGNGTTTETRPVELVQNAGYSFDIVFGPGLPSVRSDEGPPLGRGQGPSPAQLLVAAVCNCLSASLYFALSKFKDSPEPVSASGVATVGRNAENHLRVLAIRVNLKLGVPAAALPHLEKALARFESFCTVTQSVRAEIPVEVQVYDGDGNRVY